MIKFFRTSFEGWWSVSLLWHDEPFARRGIKFAIHTPTEGVDAKRPRGRFVALIQWGPGAGYIGGWTAYFAFRCKDSRPASKLRGLVRTPIQFGITGNANLIPYPY